MNLLFLSSRPGVRGRGVTATNHRWASCFSSKALLLLGGAFLALHTLSALGQTSSVTLAWNAVTNGGVTGYRVYAGTASRAYTRYVDAGNATQAAVSSLTNGTTYFFAVTAYNAAGLESDFSTEVSYTPTVTSTQGNLVFAADSGTISAPFSVSNGIVSQTVQTSLSGSGRAAYSFTITNAGPYMVSAMVNAPNNSANSFYVNIDAEPTDPQNVWDIPVTTGFMSRTVSWTTGGAPQIFNLAAGNHQLIIRGREANTQLGMITISPVIGLLQISRLTGGAMLLSGFGQVGDAYDVQASANLKNWTTIGNFTVDSSGTFSFIDHNAGSLPIRFYRLRDQTLAPATASLRVSLQPGKVIRLVGVGLANQNYDVQAATDLKNWTVIGTLTADSSGNFSFTDTTAPSFSTRMYRLHQSSASLGSAAVAPNLVAASR